MAVVTQELISAVQAQMGMEDMPNLFHYTCGEIAEIGADGGWSGFTGTTEMIEFFVQNREAISDLVKQFADDNETDDVEMAVSLEWICGLDSPDVRECVRCCLHGGSIEHCDLRVPIALALFSLQEVAVSVRQKESAT